MAKSTNVHLSADALNADDVEVFNPESTNVRKKVCTISNITLPPWNLPSTSASAEILAAPTIVTPAIYIGQTVGDIINAGSVNSYPILRTYIETGEKISTLSHPRAFADQNTGEDGALPELADFHLDDINFSQCTDNISLSAFDELISPSLNFEKVPSVVGQSLEKSPSMGELSEDEFTTDERPAGKGKVRMFKGRVPALSLKKRSLGKRNFKRCKPIISTASSEGVLSEDEFDTPIGTKRVRLNKGRFSKGRLLAIPVEKRPSGKSHLRGAVSENECVSLAGCSQSTSVFSQQSDRDTLKKFKELKRTTAETTKALEEQIKIFNSSLQNDEKRMSNQGERVEQARQAVEEARLNLQKAMSTLDAEEIEYNSIRNDIQILQQSAETCQKKLVKARKKYERLR